MVVGYEQIGWIYMWLDLYKKNLNPEIFWHAYIIFVVYSTEGWTDRRTWWINCEIIFLLWRRGYWYSGKKIKKKNPHELLKYFTQKSLDVKYMKPNIYSYKIALQHNDLPDEHQVIGSEKSPNSMLVNADIFMS